MSDNHQKNRVYQLDFEEYLVKEGLTPKRSASLDYLYQRCVPLKGAERSQAIDDLISFFPEGALTREGDNGIVYNLEPKELNRMWLERIRSIVDGMDEENISYCTGPTASLIRCLQNPLNTEFMFCVQELPFSWTPHPSSDFLRALSALGKGDRIYVGSVLECM